MRTGRARRYAVPVADSRSRRRPEKKGANVRIDRRRPDAREPGGEDMNRSELAADIATQPFLPKSAADRVVGAVFIAIRRGARARRTRGPCGLREPHRQATPGPTGTEPAYRREHRHRRVHGAVVHGGQGASRRRHQGAHMHRPPDSAPRPMSGPQTHRPRRGPLCNASPPPRPHAPRLNSGRFLPDCLISAYSGEADRRFRCEADHPVRPSRSPVGAKRRGGPPHRAQRLRRPIHHGFGHAPRARRPGLRHLPRPATAALHRPSASRHRRGWTPSRPTGASSGLP